MWSSFVPRLRSSRPAYPRMPDLNRALFSSARAFPDEMPGAEAETCPGFVNGNLSHGIKSRFRQRLPPAVARKVGLQRTRFLGIGKPQKTVFGDRIECDRRHFFDIGFRSYESDDKVGLGVCGLRLKQFRSVRQIPQQFAEVPWRGLKEALHSRLDSQFSCEAGWRHVSAHFVERTN